MTAGTYRPPRRPVFYAGGHPVGPAGSKARRAFGPEGIVFRKTTSGAFSVEADSGDSVRLVLSLNEACRIETLSEGKRREASPKVGAVTIIPPGTRYTQTITGAASALLFEFPWQQLSDWMAADIDHHGEGVELEARLCCEDDVLARSLLGLANGQSDALHAAFARMIRSHSNRGGITARRSAALTPFQVKRLTAMIEDRLCDGVTIDDMVGEVGLSKFHLIRAFKATLGSTPHRYMLDRKAGRALEALLDEGAEIEGVAARMGFSHGSHLSRILKRRFGVTPAEFRRTIQASASSKVARQAADFGRGA